MAADAEATKSPLTFALPPPMSSVDRLWLDVLWELDRERDMGKAPPGRAVMYREGMPLARVTAEDDDNASTPRTLRRPRVVIGDDAVEVALAMARLSPSSTTTTNDDSTPPPQRALHPMLAVSAHEARRWAATEDRRSSPKTRRAASAEGGVLLRTNAWNGLRPVPLDPQRQTLAELLGEGALDDLPVTNREMADDEACVVTGVAARRTLSGEPCALSSRADLDVVAYPRPAKSIAAHPKKGGAEATVAAIDKHLGLVFQTAQMFGKDAVVVCVDLETARDPQSCARAGEVGARALREGAFRDVVFVVPPAEVSAVAVDALGTRPQSTTAATSAAETTDGPPQEERHIFPPPPPEEADDIIDDIFAFVSSEPPPPSAALPEPPPFVHHAPPPSPPRHHHCAREDRVVQTDTDTAEDGRVASDKTAEGEEEQQEERRRKRRGHRPRIVFEVRTHDASADLDDRLDEWQFCGGAQRTFPLVGGGGGGSHDAADDADHGRNPASPEDRQVSIRLVRHLARALLATLATRTVPHAPGAYVWASIDVDTPVGRVFLEVRAVSSSSSSYT